MLLKEGTLGVSFQPTLSIKEFLQRMPPLEYNAFILLTMLCSHAQAVKVSDTMSTTFDSILERKK